VTANNEVFQLPGAREAWDPNTPTGLAASAAEISRQAEMIAYVNAFLVVGIVAAAVVPLVLIVRKPES
jgi:DHA2 family multidrug resistance protein